MSARTFILGAHREARARALQYIAETPDGFSVTVAPPRRNGDQNARLHATLGEIASQIKWAGELRDIDTWKRLLTAAWLRARGENVQFLPAIDGHGVDIVFRHTSSLTRGECAELIDYVTAWAIDHGVTLTETA